MFFDLRVEETTSALRRFCIIGNKSVETTSSPGPLGRGFEERAWVLAQASLSLRAIFKVVSFAIWP